MEYAKRKLKPLTRLKIFNNELLNNKIQYILLFFGKIMKFNSRSYIKNKIINGIFKGLELLFTHTMIKGEQEGSLKDENFNSWFLWGK